MKQWEYWLVIGLAALLTFSGCIQTSESSVVSSEASGAVSSGDTTINSQSSTIVSETSSMVNSEMTTIDLEEQYDENELMEILSKHTVNGIAWIIGVFEYPSPDKIQKFIEVSVCEGDSDSWAGDRNYIFFNDLDNFFYAYDDNYQESIGAIWIDNDTVAIAAEFIVNLETGERRDIGEPVISDKLDGLTKWRMRSGLYIEELDSLIYITDYDMVFYLFQYDLEDGTWTELAERPFDTSIFISNYIHFKRENENEVSFNTETKQRLSFNFYTKEFREIPYVGDYYGE